MALPLTIDILGRRFTASQTSKADPAKLVLRQGETVKAQLFFVDSTAGTLSSPFPSYWAPAGLTIKLGICAGAPTGGSDTLLVYQDTWTEISNGYQGSLNINTVAIASALASASSVECTIEIEVTESGESPVKLVQAACTITAAVIDDGAAIPTPAAEYPTRNEANATYVKRIGLAGETIVLVSPDGTKAVELACTDAGKLDVTEIPNWP